MKEHKIYTMSFGRVYPLYVAKLARKGRTQLELDEVIFWLTGYSKQDINRILQEETDFRSFFANAPRLNPKRKEITGKICGVKVEEIEDPLMQNIRYLDKLVDDLARGKKLEALLKNR
ncbi:MAG: DUF2200 domain-containing protein [Candidatus Dojkabacteria bacterium]|uniref:DUF2200 domain-containing protein n=2 Tax=Candidatus Dojkabacteria TaxID=74243 RepID=A0A136KEU9_9BACT|nr:MAG: hypothetical protein UZ20_WS6002001064 [candidate division WS6 bacterium OLB21]MBW7953633.1 DUF2200 domain-containing protein [Candidatus Dojkabacteria bacterium]WKZ27906.1 MAG: DUF2200 domain-containing protein [Candidatus Dojkabacteria bacterium]